MPTKQIYSLIFIFFICVGGCKKDKGGSEPEPDKTIKYEISSTIFPNPERGFIRTYAVQSGGAALSQVQLQLLRGQNVSMILRVFYLNAYKTQAIDAAGLQFIQDDLDKIRTAGLKIILRFAYTDDMNGTDASLATVEQHLDQLKPLFEANKDIIAFVQAGFIGAWGEWHSSSNGLATVENQRAVLNKLLSVLPTEIMVQVRTPKAKQNIFNTADPVTSAIAYTAEGRSRVGHHNDCFLTGGDEYGTYQNIALEKQYIGNEALFVPVGGETCPPTGGYSPTCTEGQKEMKALRWTYLNLDYYPQTINAWRTSGCFDEFQRYLGYRLGLVSANIPEEVSLNGSLKLSFTINNKGYAPLYNKKKTSLVLKNKTSGQLYTVAMSIDLRKSKPLVDLLVEETLNLTGVPAGDYDVYLRIADTADALKDRIEYSVRLGNNGLWTEDNGGMNSLKHQLKVLSM